MSQFLNLSPGFVAHIREQRALKREASRSSILTEPEVAITLNIAESQTASVAEVLLPAIPGLPEVYEQEPEGEPQQEVKKRKLVSELS